MKESSFAGGSSPRSSTESHGGGRVEGSKWGGGRKGVTWGVEAPSVVRRARRCVTPGSRRGAGPGARRTRLAAAEGRRRGERRRASVGEEGAGAQDTVGAGEEVGEAAGRAAWT